jgi:hypothetical protein
MPLRGAFVLRKYPPSLHSYDRSAVVSPSSLQLLLPGLTGMNVFYRNWMGRQLVLLDPPRVDGFLWDRMNDCYGLFMLDRVVDRID